MRAWYLWITAMVFIGFVFRMWEFRVILCKQWLKMLEFPGILCIHWLKRLEACVDVMHQSHAANLIDSKDVDFLPIRTAYHQYSRNSGMGRLDHPSHTTRHCVATSRAASLITQHFEIAFTLVKHNCQNLHHALVPFRYIPLSPAAKQKLWVTGDASFAPTGEKNEQSWATYHGVSSEARVGENLIQWRLKNRIWLQIPPVKQSW